MPSIILVATALIIAGIIYALARSAKARDKEWSDTVRRMVEEQERTAAAIDEETDIERLHLEGPGDEP